MHKKTMDLDHVTVSQCKMSNPPQPDPPTAAEMLMSDFREAGCILEHVIIYQPSY